MTELYLTRTMNKSTVVHIVHGLGWITVTSITGIQLSNICNKLRFSSNFQYYYRNREIIHARYKCNGINFT